MKLTVGEASGEAVRFEDGVLHAVIDRAFAPGAPLNISIGEMALDGKTIGSKRRDDGRFDVRIRLRNVRREDRALLLTMVRGP